MKTDSRRSELLKNADYPEFTEGKRALCRRLRSCGARVLHFTDGTQKSMMAKAHVVFAGFSGPWSEGQDLFREGDWVGLRLDPRGKVLELRLLAANHRTDSEADSAFMVDKAVLQDWSLFLNAVRTYFTKRGFLEVQTPTLVTCPGTEPFLDVFETEFLQGQRREKFFLPTSPELHLKKMVAQGFGPLFEMRPCFRNGEISDLHQPEFWMLEWYRPGQNLAAIQKDCVDLAQACAKALEKSSPRKVVETTMAALFAEHLDFQLTPSTTAAELIALAKKQQLPIQDDWDFDDAFYYLFLEKIEGKIPRDRLLFLKDYPPSQAALARLTANGWGDRFEMYWRGMELANAYHELNDPVIQRQRSRQDMQKRDQLGRQKINLDESFFQALEAGMPPTAGVALGLERLFLALTGRHSLNEIRAFPLP